MSGLGSGVASGVVTGMTAGLHEAGIPRGLHAAIIMDGNGRWAVERGLPRVAGHRAGADTVRRVLEAAPDLGISTLTLYAFSQDNWTRPPREVSALMKLLERYLVQETDRCLDTGVRIEAIGRRDRLPAALVALLEESERRTAGCTRLRLRLALDYSSRGAILEAVRRLPRAVSEERTVSEERLTQALGPDVDLLIRTSGEQRLSDFLLWESAYAELIFTPRKWPEFSKDDLAAAVAEFHRRERRFGAVSSQDARRTA
jgi:undecaprenyl diphosphate synthase